MYSLGILRVSQMKRYIKFGSSTFGQLIEVLFLLNAE